MRIILSAGLAFTLCAPALTQDAILFTGRFPFISLDQPNDTTSGSVTELSEFALSYVVPGAGAFARSWVPAAAQQVFLGDSTNTNNYTFFDGFKTYYQAINLAGPFIKHADKASFDPLKVYYTVRDRVAGLDITVRTAGGSVVVEEGDFFRWTTSGDVEFFITKALFQKAIGQPPTGQTSIYGASAVCQDALGNLYFSIVQGGAWVYGNNYVAGPVYCNDGSICMIDFNDITYDPTTGNVFDVTADSARVVYEETSAGPTGGPSTRDMVNNSGGVDNAGNPFNTSSANTFSNLNGLDFDPAGNTQMAAWPIGDPPNQVFPTVPDFVFTTDAGRYAGTIFSSQNGGSLAMINGVKCGEDVVGTAATGVWLGVQQNTGNFSPTVHGLAIVDAPSHVPFVLDAPSFGALQNNTVTPNIDIDGNALGASAAFLLASFGPFGPGQAAPVFPVAGLGLGSLIGADSFPWAVTFPAPVTVAILVPDGNGYVNYRTANSHTGAAVGLTLEFQGVAITGAAALQISNPIQVQLK